MRIIIVGLNNLLLIKVLNDAMANDVLGNIQKFLDMKSQWSQQVFLHPKVYPSFTPMMETLKTFF